MIAASLSGVPLALRAFGRLFATVSAGLGLVLLPFTVGFGLAGIVLASVATRDAGVTPSWARAGWYLSVGGMAISAINIGTVIRALGDAGEVVNLLP